MAKNGQVFFTGAFCQMARLNQLPDRCVSLSLTSTDPMVAVVRAFESPAGCSQLLIPLINSERRALNKHHDV